jgi:hypothetical protein
MTTSLSDDKTCATCKWMRKEGIEKDPKFWLCDYPKLRSRDPVSGELRPHFCEIQRHIPVSDGVVVYIDGMCGQEGVYWNADG